MKKKSIIFLCIMQLCIVQVNAQLNNYTSLEPARPYFNPNEQGKVYVPQTCGNPLDKPEYNSNITGTNNVNKIQAQVFDVHTESIHNVIAKWTVPPIYRFDIGTTPGSGNINAGHALRTDEYNTGGHSYPELQASAAALGTTFNIGQTFYMNLYSTSGLIQAFPLKFQWDALGLASYNVAVQIETGYGVGGAGPFTTAQAVKMQDFYNKVLPIIRSVYGAPSRDHVVTVVNDGYSVGKNTYYNGPDQVSSSYAVNSDGDLDQPRLMVHELIHAWRDNVCISTDPMWHYDPTLSGFEEGCAEGVALIVMDKFTAMYPTYFKGAVHKRHWGHEGGMPFDWDYDFQNHKQLTNANFWSSDIATGSHWLRYGMGAAAVQKMYYEDNNVFINFNTEYYNRMNANHILSPSRSMISSIFKMIKPEVERTPTDIWIDAQHIFDCTNDLRKKLFMLSFTSLSWNSFQQDNRIFFLETHKNGLEWIWNSSDQSGLNEVPDYPAPAWGWTHQLNNIAGDFSIVRDWDNTSKINVQPINANSHWINEAPNGFPNRIGKPLLGPYQGANPWVVGTTLTRDHEQDNCTLVPGCGKRAWAIGDQPLLTTSSTLGAMWPTLAMLGNNGTGYARNINNLTESGLFRFEIGFNDTKGPRVNDVYYRLSGNNFIDVKGIIGGIYSPTKNLIDGKLFIEHDGYGAEPAITISNNSFTGTRKWAAILETKPEYMHGRNDVHYTIPGKTHVVYVSNDCSQKKIDFRTITYGDDLYGTQMFLYNVDEFEDIIFTVKSNVTVCVGDPIKLDVINNFPDIFNGDPRVIYNWLSPSGTSISTNTMVNISSATLLSAGVYTLEIGFFGCPVFQKTVNVAVGAGSQLTLNTSPITVCATNSVQLNVNAIGGAATYTYNWSGPNTFVSNIQNPVITNASTVNAGVYTVTVTSVGCGGVLVSQTSTLSVAVTTSSNFSLTAQPNFSVCSGSLISLNSTTVTGASYLWSGPNSFTSSLQNPSIVSATAVNSGIYTVTVTATGCGGAVVSQVATTTVVVNPAILFSLSTPSIITICPNDPINLNVNAVGNGASYTYNWSGPNLFTSTVQSPTVISTGTINSGIYTVTVITTGCGGAVVSQVATATVIVNPAIVFSLSTPSIITVCPNDPINLNVNAIGNGTSYTYNWSGPNLFSSTVQSPTVISAGAINSGVYTVTVTTIGCGGAVVSQTASATVNVNSVISFSANMAANLTVCQSNPINLNATVVGNGSNYSFNWSGPNSFSSAVQSPTITSAGMLNAGVYTVTVTANDCGGAVISETATTTVIVNPAILFSLTTQSVITLCPSDQLNLNVNAIGNATSYSYNWSGPNSFNSAIQNPTITSASMVNSGVYTVTVIAPNCGGTTISQTATINVIVNSAISFSLTTVPTIVVCQSNPINLNVVANGNGLTYSYNWSGPNSFSSTLQNPTIINAANINSGIYTTTVTTVGCGGAIVAQTSSINVIVNSIPTVTASITSSSLAICQGKTFTLTVNPITTSTYTCLWTGPGGFASSQLQTIISNASTSGIYYASISIDGCNSSDPKIISTASVAVTVISNPALTLNAIPLVEVCSGSPAQLSVNTIPTATYLWTGPNSFSSNLQMPIVPTVTANSVGTYSVMAHYVNQCIDTSLYTSVIVKTLSLNGIVLTVNGDAIVCQYDVLKLMSTSTSSVNTYLWTSPTNQTISTISTATVSNFASSNAGTYMLTVNYGCPDLNITKSFTVEYQDDEICHPIPSYYLPTGFSPNGDGKNDILYLYGNSIERMNLSIYDRWGTEVFTSNSQSVGWDGTYKGDPLNSAVFGYKLSVTLKDNLTPINVKGNISLVR